VWDAFVDLSNDQGVTWEKSRIVPFDHENSSGKGIIQPTLWETEDGRLHMLLRSTEGYIYRSDSADGGRAWSEPYSSGLPNNNSGIDLVQTQDGRLVLAHNPVSGNWAPRTPLVLSVSEDQGETWKQAFVLERGEGEYSYPAIIEAEGKLYVTYTWNRKRIAFWELDLS
jgi:predicted neuraminidase